MRMCAFDLIDRGMSDGFPNLKVRRGFCSGLSVMLLVFSRVLFRPAQGRPLHARERRFAVTIFHTPQEAVLILLGWLHHYYYLAPASRDVSSVAGPRA